MIENLNQMKKLIQPGVKLEILKHHRADCVGQIRHVTLKNTVGFYSVVDGQPEHQISKSNHGLGWEMNWRKAQNWDFRDNVCIFYPNQERREQDEPLLAFRVLNEEAA